MSVKHADGKFFAPDNVWRHADEAILRDAQTFEYGYWHSRGTDTLTLPPNASWPRPVLPWPIISPCRGRLIPMTKS